MSLRLRGSTSGYAEIDAPAVAGNNTLILPGGNGTADQVLSGNGSGTLSWVDRGRMTLATAQNTTSGTAIDFTGIPSWVKRITVMFNGVSTNGTSAFIVQLGAGSVASSGYLSSSSYGTTAINTTAGMIAASNLTSATLQTGLFMASNITGNTWISSATVGANAGAASIAASIGSVALSGTLDRIRITTASGDTFDAGSVNILYEG